MLTDEIKIKDEDGKLTDEVKNLNREEKLDVMIELTGKTIRAMDEFGTGMESPYRYLSNQFKALANSLHSRLR